MVQMESCPEINSASTPGEGLLLFLIVDNLVYGVSSPVVPSEVKVVVKETLPGTAWRDAHQLPLTEQPGQPGLAVGSTAEVGGEHLQQGQGLQTPVHH